MTLEKVGPAAFEAEKPFVYELIVRNLGSAPAYEVLISDPFPIDARFLRCDPPEAASREMVSWKIGLLEAGAERRIRVELLAGSRVDLEACPTQALFSTKKIPTPKVTLPQLQLTVAGPELVQVGETVVLSMKVANVGTVPAVNLILHDLLPGGLEHPEGKEIEADLGALAPGESKTVSLQARAVDPGLHVNQATVAVNGTSLADERTKIEVLEPVPAPRPEMATTPGALDRPHELGLDLLNRRDHKPTLLLEVTDLNDPLAVGAETTYEIRVLNQDPTALTNLQLFVNVTDGLLILNADGPVKYLQQGDRVIFETMPQLDSRADLLYRVRVKGMQPGEGRLRAELGCDQLSQRLLREETTRVEKSPESAD